MVFVFNGFQWFSMVFRWSRLVSDGLGWSRMFLDGLSGLSESAIEWFKTPKPLSGWDWDWMGLDGYPGGRRYRAPYGANNRVGTG